MQWENNIFSKRNLEIGKQLNQKGAVKEVELIGDKLYGLVEDGAATYRVEVTLDGMNLVDYSCNCKLHENSRRCHHVVAALENWFKEHMDNSNYSPVNPLDNPFEKIESKKNQIYNFVQNSDDSYKDEFLANFLTDDKKLLTEYLINSGNKLTEPDMFMIAEYLEDLCVRYCTDKKRKWMRERDIAYDLDEFLHSVIKPLAERGNQLNAFTLIAYIFEIINEYELDETTSGVRELENDLVSFLESYLSEIPEDEVDYVFNWFLESFPTAKDGITGQFVRNAFCDFFNEDQLVDKKLALLYELLSQRNDDPDSSSVSYSKGATINDVVASAFKIAKNSNNPEEIVSEIIQKYPDIFEVKKNYYEFLKDQENYEEAVNVIDEILDNLENKPILKQYYLNEKKNLSSKLNNREGEVSNLEELALHYDNDNFDYASELKSKLSDDEWNEASERLRAQYKDTENEADFLAYLQDYEALLELVVTKKDFKSFEKYFDVLSNVYPKESLDAYADFLEDKVKVGKNREAYRVVIDHLKKMEKMDSGKDYVLDLVVSWKDKFKTKRALMDELEIYELKLTGQVPENE